MFESIMNTKCFINIYHHSNILKTMNTICDENTFKTQIMTKTRTLI